MSPWSSLVVPTKWKRAGCDASLCSRCLVLRSSMISDSLCIFVLKSPPMMQAPCPMTRLWQADGFCTMDSICARRRISVNLLFVRSWCVKINHVEGSARWSLDAKSLCFAKFLIRYQPVEHSESKARRLPAIPYREVGCAHFVLCFEIWPLCSMPTHIAPCGHACFGDTLHHHRRQVCVYAPDFAHTKNRRIVDPDDGLYGVV